MHTPEQHNSPIESSSVITDEQRRAMEEWLKAHPYGEQDANGIDLSTIRRNLRLSPTERLTQLQQAANSLLKLRNVRANYWLPYHLKAS